MGNICGDANNPLFVDADSNDFHISPSSPCIDVGDPNVDYTGEVDIDGDDRVIDVNSKGDDVNDVDMGADEYGDSAFRICDSNDNSVAIFDQHGNVFLKGTLDSNTTPDANSSIDEFIIEDTSSNELAIISGNNGNMYLYGFVFESQGTLTPCGTNNFIIEDSDGNTIAYIDDPNGDLYLKRWLYEQVLN